MNYTLRFLSPDRFCTHLRWLAGSGDGQGDAGKEATCVIAIHHPERQQTTPFYAKFYPDLGGRSRALANEITAYVLANRFGLPQPPRACIMQVPLNKIRLPQLREPQHAWLKQIAKTNATWPAYCTEAVNAPTPWIFFGEHAQAALRDDVCKWPDLPRALTFDDVIANVDRHLNNLLRLSQSRYALIDHGRLVASDGHWNREHLDADAAFTNRLLDILYSGQALPVNGMVLEAEQASVLLTGLHEINRWLSQLLPNEEERVAFDKFLQRRTISAPTRIAERYQLC